MFVLFLPRNIRANIRHGGKNAVIITTVTILGIITITSITIAAVLMSIKNELKTSALEKIMAPEFRAEEIERKIEFSHQTLLITTPTDKVNSCNQLLASNYSFQFQSMYLQNWTEFSLIDPCNQTFAIHDRIELKGIYNTKDLLSIFSNFVHTVNLHFDYVDVKSIELEEKIEFPILTSLIIANIWEDNDYDCASLLTWILYYTEMPFLAEVTLANIRLDNDSAFLVKEILSKSKQIYKVTMYRADFCSTPWPGIFENVADSLRELQLFFHPVDCINTPSSDYLFVNLFARNVPKIFETNFVDSKLQIQVAQLVARKAKENNGLCYRIQMPSRLQNFEVSSEDSMLKNLNLTCFGRQTLGIDTNVTHTEVQLNNIVREICYENGFMSVTYLLPNARDSFNMLHLEAVPDCKHRPTSYFCKLQKAATRQLLCSV